ncbi:hypothetical protein COCON_G00055450 [Conger conger]|uniref:Uncharacterized protein n=1 Tax=Conger conger TaxID=82655 RepID=A0A9Q1DWB3_CONCO|nr:hypothetical protein COCON_G00055450 [Conger conger]
MSDRECYGDGLCGDGAPEFHPGRASRAGRRSGVILPVAERSSPGGQESEILLESVKAAPRRSSIIKGPGVWAEFLVTRVIIWGRPVYGRTLPDSPT